MQADNTVTTEERLNVRDNFIKTCGDASREGKAAGVDIVGNDGW